MVEFVALLKTSLISWELVKDDEYRSRAQRSKRELTWKRLRSFRELDQHQPRRHSSPQLVLPVFI
jgi:hypothetical protein